jgi:hypothetical protein
LMASKTCYHIQPPFVWFLRFTKPFTTSKDLKCRNPNLGLVTKARTCKVASQDRSPRVTSHTLRSAKECEGVNPHTPKWTPILGVGIPNELLIFKEQWQGQTHWIKAFLISLESSWNVNISNGFEWPIWTSKTQVMAKRKDASQISNFTLDH